MGTQQVGASLSRWRARAASLCAAVSMLVSVSAVAQTPSFIEFDSAHVRPMALSPDGTRLFAVNTPDNRLEVFSVSASGLSLLAEVPATGRAAAFVDEVLAATRRIVPAARAGDQARLVDPLSEREVEVLRYLASRLDSSEIAAALYISVNTVRSHVKAVYRKLGVNARPDAVARGRELGLL